MIRNTLACVAMLGCALTITTAAAQRAGGGSVDSIFRQLDANGDGAITIDEIPPNRTGMRDNFDRLDRNGDGELSSAELSKVMNRAGGGRTGSRSGAGTQRAPAPAPARAPTISADDIANAPVVALPSPVYDTQTRTLTLRADGREMRVQVTWPDADEGAFPLIVYSPYLGGIDPGYLPLMEFLAGHGFVTVLMAHEESVSAGVDQRALGNWRERPQDFVFVLDHLDELERIEPDLRGRIDDDAIGVSGHLIGAFGSSFLVGARTRDGETFEDERVKAALLMAGQGRGSTMNEDSWNTIDAPMMVIVGSEHPSRRTGNPAAWRTEPFVFSEPPDKYLVFVQGMDGRFGGLFPAKGDRYLGQANAGLESYVLSATLDFWNAYLNGDARAKSSLDLQRLEAASGGIAEIETKTANSALAGYAPAAGAYRAGVESLEMYDPERRRTIPLRIYAPENAPPAGGWPAVVFSHGLGESRDSYHYLGEALAANGYAIVFMSHAGSDSESFSRSGYRGLDTVDNAQSKAGDMHFVVDALINDRIDSPLVQGRIAAGRIAAGGQCAGSSVAASMVGLRAMLPGNENFAPADPNFKALLMLGPQVPNELAQPRRASSGKGLDMLRADSWEGVDVPMLVVAGTRDFVFFEGVKADPRIRVLAYDSARSGEKYLLDLAGGAHHAFTDSQPWYPGGPRNPDHHAWIVESAVAFLDAYLKDDERALAWLQNEELERQAGGQAQQEHVSTRTPDVARAAAAAPAAASRSTAARHTDVSYDAGDGYYKAARGPYDFEVERKLVLRDGARNKDLQMRVTYPVGDGPFPVLVFVHGAWASNEMYQPMIEHWASHGYVSLQANHADSTALGVEMRDESVFRDWQARPGDVHFMLDSLDEIERQLPGLAGKLDQHIVGIGGHSYGAHTAQLVGGTRITDFRSGDTLSFADERADAILLLSPQGRGNQLDEHAWDALRKPLMTMTGSRDPGRKGDGIQWRLDPFVFAASPDKYLLFIDGVHHNFGGATGGGIPGGRGRGEDNADFVRYVRSASVAFWDAYLKGSDDALAYLRSGTIDELSRGEATLTSDEADAAKILADLPSPGSSGRRRR